MTAETFLDGRVTLHPGDCLEVLAGLEEGSVDACVTDPPYHLTNNTGSRSPNPGQYTPIGKPKEPRGGFMGKQWDGGDIAFRPETWAAVYRVLKPGAHLLAFSGTRTYHRMVCAIEDAGFEIRDCIQWLYGSGFPKSHDVAKHLDKAEGFWRGRAGAVTIAEQVAKGTEYERTDKGEPITDAAREWQGWGTALKPACEPIVLARKPLIGTIAANVLAHGTGALNIDGCRVATEELTPRNNNNTETLLKKGFEGEPLTIQPSPLGRWPANVIHDGSEEVVGAFPESESSRSIITSKPGDIYGGGKGLPSHTGEYGFNDSGSAARFFYTAKADSDDRLGSKHPTVKPLDLMQYLVRLITPKGGTVLDLFAGTGTTGEAAWREGMRAVLIEREAEYQGDIRRRMKLANAGPDERGRESIKANGKAEHPGPLFGDCP